MRLATEETWAQLSGALAPASLTRSISQVRAKLADHYRQTLDELAAAIGAIGSGAPRPGAAARGARSAAAGAAARGPSGGTRTSSSRRRGSLAREQELDRQQQHYEQMESQWHLERTDYQAEIRRLLATIRDLEIEEMRAA